MNLSTTITLLLALLAAALVIGSVFVIFGIEDRPKVNYICSCDGDAAVLSIEPADLDLDEKVSEKE